MINQTFNPNEMKTGFPETGEYIFIESSPSKYITVRAETSMGIREYTMKERETNHVPKGETFTSLTVTNGEQGGDIVIRTGFGDFKQSNDHQKVTVDNEINLPSNITFASAQPIYPSVGSVFATQVQNFPAEYPVTFKGTQPVSIGQSLTIDDSTPVKVEVSASTQLVTEEKDPVINALPSINIDGTLQSIAAKAGRKGLLLQAPSGNNGDIVVQGFLRVEAGAVVPFPASNLVTIQGSDGDVLYVGEQL